MVNGFIRRNDHQFAIMGTLLAQIATFSQWNDPSKHLFERKDFVRLSNEAKQRAKKAKVFTAAQMEYLNNKFNS